MIVKLAFAALISGIAIPALAVQLLGCVESRPALPGADAAVSTVSAASRPNLGPFLSGLI